MNYMKGAQKRITAEQADCKERGNLKGKKVSGDKPAKYHRDIKNNSPVNHIN